jgi:hypothetical protein
MNSFDEKLKKKIVFFENHFSKNKSYLNSLLDFVESNVNNSLDKNNNFDKNNNLDLDTYKLKDNDLSLFKEVLNKGIIDFLIDFLKEDIKYDKDESKKSIEQIIKELKKDKEFI